MEQYYLWVSAPITENLAYRFNAISVERDGVQKNPGTGPDANSLDDENIVLTLLWNIADDMSFKSERMTESLIVL